MEKCDKIVQKNKDGEKIMSENTGRQAHASDMTDKQWEEIKPLYIGMCTYKWSKRELTNVVLYLVNSGGKWR